MTTNELIRDLINEIKGDMRQSRLLMLANELKLDIAFLLPVPNVAAK